MTSESTKIVLPPLSIPAAEAAAAAAATHQVSGGTPTSAKAAASADVHDLNDMEKAKVVATTTAALPVAAPTITTATTITATAKKKLPPIVEWRKKRSFVIAALVLGAVLIALTMWSILSAILENNARSSSSTWPPPAKRHRPNQTTPVLRPNDPVSLRAMLMTQFINNITLLEQKPIVLPHRVYNNEDDQATVVPTSLDLATDEEVALYFLVYQDPMQLPVPNWTDWSTSTSMSSTTTPSTIAAVQAALELIQRYAILTLSIIPASPDGSDDDMIGKSVCEWRGTVCNKTTVPWLYNPNIMVTYNAVTHIYWSDVGGDGHLRPDLGLLHAALVHFDVSHNYIDGSIPTELGLWTHLQYFNVSHNDLTGSLPSSLEKWTAIEHVDIFNGNNRLTGSIPWSSVANWTSLRDNEA